MRRIRWRDDEGVTLVELMVALLILGLLLSALASALVASLAGANRQQIRVQATTVGSQVIEEAQGQLFRNVALCQSEAVATFGSPLTFEGNPLVLLPDADAQCSNAQRLRPTRTVTLEDVTYQVRLAITWIDDPADGLGAADATGTDDYKRIVTDLTWTERGQTRTFRAEGRVAPEAFEQPLRARINPREVPLRDSSENPPPPGPSVVGRNRVPFTITAVHTLKQNSMSVRFAQRNTADRVIAMTSGDGGFTWTFTVPSNDGLFPNGETLFTFTATDPAGTVTTLIDRALFLHDLAYRAVPTSQPAMTPTTIEVLPSGTVCPVTVNAYMQGVLLSDAVDVAVSDGLATPVRLTGFAQTEFGANFTRSLQLSGLTPGESVDFTFSSTRVNLPPATPVSQTISDVPVVGVAACSS
ncbi:MAG: prepilin-type N-terminal cleavage/methylation domain-containing protein [Actinomycetes bacterium]